MPRSPRSIAPGTAYHVYDRGNLRAPLFEVPDQYDLFLGLLGDARRRGGARLLAFCVMPNHWHLLLQPEDPRGLRDFVARVKQVQTQRWHGLHRSWGEGRLYQGRFHSRPLESGEAVLACCRYVERNALAADLVSRAEEWPWGSLWHRVRGDPQELLDPLPVELPPNWRDLVNAEKA